MRNEDFFVAFFSPKCASVSIEEKLQCNNHNIIAHAFGPTQLVTHKMTFLFRDSGNNLQVPQDDGPSKLSASYRDGKFRDLSEFMEVDNNEKALWQGYKAIGITNIRPGLIIHISDERSRLDRRVMLVLRKSSMSFMCLTFCSHFPPPEPDDHWRVCDEGKAKVPIQDQKLKELQALEVVLQPYGRSTSRVSPEADVTVNIQDIWNVENEVNVKVLGEVVSSALPPLFKAIKELFCQNLDKAVTPSEGVAKTDKERRDSRNEGTKYLVRVSSHRRKPRES